MIDKIQALGRLNTDKIQALEKPVNENIFTQTQEFRVEPTAPLHCETEKEQPMVIIIPTLSYPITIQD